MASSGNSAATSCPEPAGAIPETGDAIAAEIRSRHASIAENFKRLRAVRSVVTKLCELVQSRCCFALRVLLMRICRYADHPPGLRTDRASFDVSKVSTEGVVSVEEDEQETPVSAFVAPFPPGVALE